MLTGADEELLLLFDFWPDLLPSDVSDSLKEMRIKCL